MKQSSTKSQLKQASKSPKKKETKQKFSIELRSKGSPSRSKMESSESRKSASKSPSRSSRTPVRHVQKKSRSRSHSRGRKIDSQRMKPKVQAKSRPSSRSQKIIKSNKNLSKSFFFDRPKISIPSFGTDSRYGKIYVSTEKIIPSDDLHLRKDNMSPSGSLSSRQHVLDSAEELLRRRTFEPLHETMRSAPAFGSRTPSASPKKVERILEKAPSRMKAHFRRFGLFYIIVFLLCAVVYSVYSSGHQLEKTLKELQNRMNDFLIRDPKEY